MAVNTAALKSFAPAMRRQLLEAVGRKLDLLLHSQTPDTLSTYAKQIAELREKEAENREKLLERVAYTWFNRLCALRYLDARGWHPFGCKVLMPAGEGETQPELLKLMRAGSLPRELKTHTNESRLHGLLDVQIPTAIPGADPQGEVYRELVLASCRSYHQLLPNLFEGLDNATELLLPDDQLTEGSIAGSFRRELSDEDCRDPEIIGWLYQFYISEKKAQVIGKVVKSEDIPAATQLFTPNWIVKYMVENSLGACWLNTYPDSPLKGHMKYFIEPIKQTERVKKQVDSITPTSLNPEELTLIDPACGSGHILAEAYDLFKAIYLERGYQLKEIPRIILEKNLYGLDIDERAAQLTSFALMMKGRADDRRVLERGIKLNVIALMDSDRFDPEALAEHFNLTEHGLNVADLSSIKKLFEHAESFGSLIQVPQKLAAKLPSLKRLSAATGHDLFVSEMLKELRRLVEQATMLSAQYNTVVANPPYMGSKYMNDRVKKFARKEFPSAKNDLFACFLQRGHALTGFIGYCSMVTMETWMFLSGYEHFRSLILRHFLLRNLLHLPYDGKQPTAMGINFGVAVVSFQKSTLADYLGHYCCSRYYELNSAGVPLEFPSPNERLKIASANDFKKIPGSPIAYWVGDSIRSIFLNPSLKSVAELRAGITTGDNERFVRYWHEVDHSALSTHTSSAEELWSAPQLKWVPLKSGGDFRKWWGNLEKVICFDKDSYEVLKHQGNHCASESCYFLPSLTWSDIGSLAQFGVRRADEGAIFSTVGHCLFAKPERLDAIAAYLCSAVATHLVQLINPTFHANPGDVGRLPFIEGSDIEDQAGRVSKECIRLARIDWHSYERSWSFKSMAFLRASASHHPSLKSSYSAWISQNRNTVLEMKRLEEENNHLFINAYGLQDEVTPEVPIHQITLTVNPAYRYGGSLTDEEQWSRFSRDTMAEFLSYANGCMMGRYSLDRPGLILADSRDSQSAHLAAYEAKVGKPLAEVQFRPDPDAIIPVLDGEWFEDDIVARTREFLEVTFPESTVTENLRFIEESLGKDIRKYFCSDFYKDHLQTYKKRPIYWMVQSPKKGFACLIYLHRYTKDTLNQVLNNYFRPYLQKLEARLAQLGLDQLNDSLPTRERTAARKEAEKITKVLKECQAWEQDALLPLAQQRIELDLDDGVKVNYLKLQDVLAPIPGLAAKED